MNSSYLIADIGKIIVFLMVLLSVFLITVKSKKKLSNILFAGFLLVTSVDLMGFFLLEISSNSLKSFKYASVLLQMPLYYLYVQSVCYFNFKLKPKDLFHGLPSLAAFILLMATSVSNQVYFVFEISAKVQYYCYILAVFLTLGNFKKLFEENYTTNHRNTYKWLLQTTVLFLIGNVFVQIRYFNPTEENAVFLSNINLLISLFALFVICWFMLKAMYQPDLFLGVDKNLRTLKAIEPKKENPETQQSILRLKNYMENEKPYLDPELNLQKFALHLNLPEKQISQLINQQIGKHFFDFVNEFRIRDAKNLLEEKKDFTVLEILYEVGFNSKSSFYTAFKKETQQTPTAYRKQVK